MADEQNTESQSSQPQFSEVEQKAMEHGWVPEDQYSGPGKWRSAEEFLDRGELFSKIDEIKREAKAARADANVLRQHLELVRKNEYNRALATFREEKKQALDDGDAEGVIKAEEKIEALKAQAVQAAVQQQQAPASTEPDPQFVVWKARNSWYETNKAMKVYADQIGHELFMSGEMSPKDVLVEVERRVKQEFAEKFRNPNRDKPGTVEGTTHKGTSKKDSFELTDVEKQMMKRLVKAIPGFTEEQYIADIKADRERERQRLGL